MYKRFVFFFTLSLSVSLFSQDSKTGTVKVRKPVGKYTILSVDFLTYKDMAVVSTGSISTVDVPPVYVPGDLALQNYIAKNKVYPPKAARAGITGKVIVSFIVGVDGALSGIQVVKGLGYGCDEEALRLVRSLPGKWTPGIARGAAVPVQYYLPVTFSAI